MQQFSYHGGYLAQFLMSKKSLIKYTPSAVALLHFQNFKWYCVVRNSKEECRHTSLKVVKMDQSPWSDNPFSQNYAWNTRFYLQFTSISRHLESTEGALSWQDHIAVYPEARKKRILQIILNLPHNYKVGMERLGGLFKNSIIQYCILNGIRGGTKAVLWFTRQKTSTYIT